MDAAEWTKIASLYDGPRAVGGRLVVGEGRLKFVPHRVDRALAGRALDVPLLSVEALTLTSRSWFAPRRHVLVETSDGVRARLLVNGARALIDRLADAVRAAGGSPNISS